MKLNSILKIVLLSLSPVAALANYGQVEKQTGFDKPSGITHLQINNLDKKDLFCPRISLSSYYFKMGTKKPVGAVTRDFESVFVKKNSSVRLEYAPSYEAASAQVQIGNVRDDYHDDCFRQATLHQYCAFSPMSDEEERSMAAVLESFGRNKVCQDLMGVRPTSLVLRRNGITDVYFVRFMPELRKLLLPNNQIAKIQNLESLVELERVDFSQNPLKNLKGIEKAKALKGVVLKRLELEKLESLAGLKNLRFVDLERSYIKNLRGLDQLGKACVNLYRTKYESSEENREIVKNITSSNKKYCR